MQLQTMKNIIDSVRARAIPALLEELHLEKIFTKKALTVVSAITYIPLVLAAMFLPKDFIFSMAGLFTFILWGGAGTGAILNGFKEISMINKKIMAVNDGNIERIYSVSYDFAQIKQKLYPEEVQQLLKLSFTEDDFKTLSYEIKDKGYLTHDDVYNIYKRLTKEIRKVDMQKEDEQRKNTNLQNFLIENKVVEQVVEKSIETTPLVSVLKEEYQHIQLKSFNSKSTL